VNNCNYLEYIPVVPHYLIDTNVSIYYVRYDILSRLLVSSDCDRSNKEFCQPVNVFPVICYEFAGPNCRDSLLKYISYSNAIGLYRWIWLVTILRKILNLKVVTKGFSCKDSTSWKLEILHVTFTTIHKIIKIPTLQTYCSLKFIKIESYTTRKTLCAKVVNNISRDFNLCDF